MPPVIPTEGLNRIAALTLADTNHYIAIGTGTTAPTSGDTALETETFRQTAGVTVTRDGNKVTWSTTIANGDLPASTTEVGVFLSAAAGSGTGELLVRATITAFVKANGDDLTLIFEITFAEG